MERKSRRKPPLDTLEFPIHDLASAITAQDAIDLNLGDMPPEDAPQPTQADGLVVKAITEQVSKAREHLRTEGQTLAPPQPQRVSKFSQGSSGWKFALLTYLQFPRERLDGHMDNIGATLSPLTSPRPLPDLHLVVEKALGQEVGLPKKSGISRVTSSKVRTATPQKSSTSVTSVYTSSQYR